MIKVYCDCCKKPIENIGDQINLSFNNLLIDAVEDEYHFHTSCAVRVKNLLEHFLSRPVQDEKEDEERKHGEWDSSKTRIIMGSNFYFCCSVCGESDPWQNTTRGHAHYCPNCGAKMDLKEGAEE